MDGPDPGEADAEAEAERLEKQLAELREEVQNPAAAAERRRQAARNALETARARVPPRPVPRPAGVAGVLLGPRSQMPAAVKRKVAELSGPAQDEEPATARLRPDWTGRAAPNTPGALPMGHRPWTQPFQVPPAVSTAWSFGKGAKGKGKGKGPRPYRSYGIASLDESARLHGQAHEGFQFGQLARYSDRELRLSIAKAEQPEQDLGISAEEEAAARQPVAPPAVLQLPKGTPTLAPMTPAPPDVYDEL